MTFLIGIAFLAPALLMILFTGSVYYTFTDSPWTHRTLGDQFFMGWVLWYWSAVFVGLCFVLGYVIQRAAAL